MPRGVRRSLTPAQAEEAARLYRAGASLSTLARQYGVAKTAVRAALVSAGAEIRRGNEDDLAYHGRWVVMGGIRRPVP